jgi:hypothetical protein
MPYLDGSAEVGGDLPAVALDAGPDVARNPNELQLTGRFVDAVDPAWGAGRPRRPGARWAPEGWARGTPPRAS